jgi:hypothetical protein
MTRHINLDRRTVLEIYCYCRQAERSVHFAIPSEAQWEGFLEYYGRGRIEKVEALVRKLEQFLPKESPGAVLDRARLCLQEGFLARLAKACVSYWRESWTFGNEEIAFFCLALAAFLGLSNELHRPPVSSLIAIRQDLYLCELIIGSRVIGVPDLRRAAQIEHFCQSIYVRPTTFAQLGLA